MASATITAKGQITIPARVREAMGLDTGDRIEFVEVEKGEFKMIAATRSVRELEGRYRGRRSTPLSIEEMNKIVARRASGLR